MGDFADVAAVRYEIRDACEADIPDIAQIYNYYVLLDQDLTTFEEMPVSMAEMRSRFEEVTNPQNKEFGFPFLVAVAIDASAGTGTGAVVGYSYGLQYKPRVAYRFSAEDSIYLHPAHTGRGLGRRLLTSLLERLRAQGIKQVRSLSMLPLWLFLMPNLH